jgi:hypothetical protein
VTVAETPDISTSELSPESELSPVTLPKNVVADVQQNEVSEEEEEATPLEQTDATSADESEEAIASLTPVEIAPEATEVVADEDEVAPQLLLQGMVETTPDPWEEEYTLVNVDDDGCGEIVRVSPQQLPDSSNMAIPNSSPLPQKTSIEVADSTAVEDAIAPLPPVEIEPQAAEAVADAQSAPNTATTIVEPCGEEAVVPSGTPTKVDTPVSQAPAAKTEIGKLAERFKYCNFVEFKALCRTKQIQAIEAAIEMVPLNDRERVQGFWERIRLKFASQ